MGLAACRPGSPCSQTGKELQYGEKWRGREYVWGCSTLQGNCTVRSGVAREYIWGGGTLWGNRAGTSAHDGCPCTSTMVWVEQPAYRRCKEWDILLMQSVCARD